VHHHMHHQTVADLIPAGAAQGVHPGSGPGPLGESFEAQQGGGGYLGVEAEVPPQADAGHLRAQEQMYSAWCRGDLPVEQQQGWWEGSEVSTVELSQIRVHGGAGQEGRESAAGPVAEGLDSWLPRRSNPGGSTAPGAPASVSTELAATTPTGTIFPSTPPAAAAATAAAAAGAALAAGSMGQTGGLPPPSALPDDHVAPSVMIWVADYFEREVSGWVRGGQELAVTGTSVP
jgi:hypothetical protein